MYIISFIGSPCFLGREGICFLIPLLCKSPMCVYTYPDVKNLKAEREVLNSTKNQPSGAYMEKLLSPRQPRIMRIHFTPSSPSYLGSIHLFKKIRKKRPALEFLLALDSSLAFSCHVACGNIWVGRNQQGLVLAYFIGLLCQHLSLNCLFFFFESRGILEECKDSNSQLYIRFQ